MSVCPYCGAEVAEGAMMCDSCFSPLDGSSPVQKKKNGGSKGALIGAIALLVIVVAAAAVLLIWGLSPSARLNRSIHKTTDALAGQITKQEQLDELADHLENVTEKHKYEASVTNGSASGGYTVSFRYNGRSKKMDGSLAVGGSGKDAAYFYVNKSTLQVQFPGISGEIFQVSLKDLKKKLSSSVLSGFIGSDIIDIIPEDFFGDMNDRTKGLDQAWKSFWKIVEVETRDKQGEYRVYHMSWNMQDLANLIQSGDKGLLSGPIMEQLRKLDGDCVCYVDKKGYLRQAELLVGGDVLTIELLGEDNPWMHFRVVSTVKGSALLEGGVEADGEHLRIYLQAANAAPVIDISYENSSGNFVFVIPGISARGKLNSDRNASRLSFGQEGKGDLTVQVGTLQDSPDRLGKHPIDVLELNLAEVTKLGIQFGGKTEEIRSLITQLVEFFQEVLS